MTSPSPKHTADLQKISARYYARAFAELKAGEISAAVADQRIAASYAAQGRRERGLE